MGIRLHCGGVITILPKGTLAILPLIVFLAYPPLDQLHRLRYDLFSFIVPNNKMNMVGGHRVVQDGGPKTYLCFKNPL